MLLTNSSHRSKSGRGVLQCYRNQKEVTILNTDKIYAESIANEYAAKATSKVLSLNKLDAKAKRPSKIFTYTFGIVSALMLGIGICL